MDAGAVAYIKDKYEPEEKVEEKDVEIISNIFIKI